MNETTKYYYQIATQKCMAGPESVLRRYHLDVELSDSPEEALQKQVEYCRFYAEKAKEMVIHAAETLRHRESNLLHVTSMTNTSLQASIKILS